MFKGFAHVKLAYVTIHIVIPYPCAFQEIIKHGNRGTMNMSTQKSNMIRTTIYKAMYPSHLIPNHLPKILSHGYAWIIEIMHRSYNL